MAPLLDESTRGVYPIMATPFTATGDIDWRSVDRLVDFYLERGADGLTVLGIMGEAPKLSIEESAAFVKRCMKRAGGRIPVVIGVSNPGLKSLGDFSRLSVGKGAAGVMITPTPGLNTEDQVYAYYQNVAKVLGDIPVVVQNYPQGNHVFMSVPLMNSLFRDFASFKVLKHEEAPGLRKLTRLRATDNERGRRISILGGNGAIHLMEELARGADGTMTGFAFPEMLIDVCRLFQDGKKCEAEDLYDAYLPYLRHEQQFGIGLAIRKETLRRRGLIDTAIVRLPGPGLDPADHEELSHLLKRLAAALKRLGAGRHAALVPVGAK